MKILFCVEFYYPSIGGAQEVVRQLAERMAAGGHDVTVATSRIKSRKFSAYKSVRIQEFAVSGNRVRGVSGEVDEYRKFLSDGDFNVVFFYAAQQWTFDAAWGVMSQISGKKVLVPCGYSGLHDPAYGKYFSELPDVLRQLDCVVYHAINYRDYQYGKLHAIDKLQIIPNGADEQEFGRDRDVKFRTQIGVPDDALLLLTVGTLTGLKGHLEVAQAFDKAFSSDQNAVLLLNGNTPARGGVPANALGLLGELVSEYGVQYALKHAAKKALWALGFKVGKAASISELVEKINAQGGGKKRVILCDLPRGELIQAYLNSDLFVFASNVEYSPLVLFEACAAGLPFLSVPVGNSVEIAAWTNGGEICPAPVDERGYTRVAPGDLAECLKRLVADQGRLVELGRQGRLAWETRYNWKLLAKEYETLFVSLLDPRGLVEDGKGLGSSLANEIAGGVV